MIDLITSARNVEYFLGVAVGWRTNALGPVFSFKNNENAYYAFDHFFDAKKGSLVAARCGGSRLQNGSGSGEDAGRALIGDFLFGLQPVLNIATAEVRAFEAKRFATNQRDGLRFNLADVPCGLFAIHKLFRCGVPENNVGDLVERRFMRECGNGIHRDFATVGEALNVAVQLVKRRPRDVQGAKCRVDVKAGNRRNGSVFPLGLREHKPIRPKPEGVASLRFGCLVLDAIGLRGSLERHGHAKGDSFFPFADLPFPFEPSAIGVEWSGLQVAADALFERKQGVPEAVIVKGGVSFEHSPRLFDRLPQ